MKKILAAATALAMATLATPGASHAESTFTTGAGTPLTGSAHLDFTIVVPKFVYIRVSTGANYATNATIDNLVFTVPAASVGNGTAIAPVGGDIGLGVVTARVMGNNGAISFTSTTTGTLNDTTGDSISYAQISTTVATNTSATALPHPTLADGATTSLSLTPNVGAKGTNLDAKWTYTYLNTSIVPPGTYGGVNVNNGRVVYAVSMP